MLIPLSKLQLALMVGLVSLEMAAAFVCMH